MRKALLGVAFALWLAPAAHAATRVLYTSDWSGHPEVYAVGPSQQHPFTQITHFHGACPEPPYYLPVALHPSPDGRYLALNCGAGLWLMRINGRDARELAPAGGARGWPSVFSRWSRDSRLLGYERNEVVHVIEPATGLDRLARPAELTKLRWGDRRNISPNGRWAAEVSLEESFVVRLRDRAQFRVPRGFDARWSPDGNRLAIESPDGIRIVEMPARRVRLLTRNVGFGEAVREYEMPSPLGLTWAPDGRSIAYVMGRESYAGASWGVATSDLRVVTMKGRVRTLVSADHAYGTQMRAVAWVNAQTPTAKLEPQTGFLAAGAVDLLAADGKRVAFEACDTIVVWTPADNTSNPHTDPNACGRSETTGRYYMYDLALAGDRLVYGLNIGCNAVTVSLFLRVLSPTPSGGVLARSFGNCGAPFGDALGRLAGSGDLLVYGEWSEGYAPGIPFPVTSAVVRRVDGTSCPCPIVTSTPGPLYPADVDEGRVLVYGLNETIVLDRNGNQLLSLPVAPRAAQLSHNDLVLLMAGELRDYDARNGVLLHTWKLPEVSGGPVCGWRVCETTRLVLNDAARGRVVYILDGKLHLLRLADGADALIREASLARFMADGLVYADGSRLHFVPYTQLPLYAP